MNPGSCAERDLFGELATAFRDAGYKVLAYMATEGPGACGECGQICANIFYFGDYD